MKSRTLVLLTSLLLIAGMCFGQSTPNDSAQSPGLPRVVARFSRENRTKGIQPVTIYTPSKTGLFRATVIFELTVGNHLTQGQSWTGSFEWANRVGVNTFRPSVATTSPESVSFTQSFSAFQDIPMTFSIISSGDVSHTEYNVYVVLEQLE
jgi:hypothetical protein